jgi:hypothetical protein
LAISGGQELKIKVAFGIVVGCDNPIFSNQLLPILCSLNFFYLFLWLLFDRKLEKQVQYSTVQQPQTESNTRPNAKAFHASTCLF